jgi:hypothetical protein
VTYLYLYGVNHKQVAKSRSPFEIKKTVVTDDNGDWKLQLSPLKGSLTPETMIISSSNSQKILLELLDDVVVGEV